VEVKEETMSTRTPAAPPSYVDLYWLPLGAGDNTGCVRWNGRIFEAVTARHERRAHSDLYHSALEVGVDGTRFVVEMAPVWSLREPDRGVVSEGPVGLAWLGGSRAFRYEVRRWRGGQIPDVGQAVGGPLRVSEDRERARRLLRLVPSFPTATWGRDEMGTGDMWNSNSLVAWLLASSDHPTDSVGPPTGGRAPGWRAGLVVAGRCTNAGSRPGG
jgi:hypothetical protein